MAQAKKKKAPPVPKFQATKQTQSQLLSKMGQLYSKLDNEQHEQPHTAPPTPPPPTAPAKPAQPQKKKLNLMNLNEKLASMMSSKKDLLKPKQEPKKQQEPAKETSNEKAGRKVDLEQEYDPNFPNNYEAVKMYYEDVENKPAPVQKHEPEPMEIEIVQQEVGLSETEEKALKMMQKYGYKVGQGLGKNKQGITTPLTIKKTTESSCIIMPSSIPMNYVVPRQVSVRTALQTHNIPQSPVIVLHNIVTIEQLNEDHESMIRQQLQKYGQVLDFMVYLLGRDLRIFVKYSNNEGAFKAFSQLNGKFYEGNTVSIRFYNQANFDTFKLDEPLHQHLNC